MASYINTVLSKNPFCFAYGNELDGDVLHDLSVNLDHGTFAAGAIKGLESPIETDPDSRAVGGANGAGFMPASAPVDDFTIAVWLFHSGFSGPATGWCRNGQPGLGHSNFVEIDFGGILVELSPHAATDYILTYPLNGVLGWYRATVVRQGPVIKLLVNGLLKDQDTSFVSDSFSSAGWISGGGFGWKVGVAGNSGNIWAGRYTCSFEAYDYPLSDADDLEIYEAARARLPMFVDISMRTYFIPDLTPPPVYAAFPYTHDFTTPAIERLIRSTEVVETKDGSEERNGQADKTRRRYTYEIPIMDAHSRRRLKALLRNNQKLPIVWPTATDATNLTDPVSPGASVVIPVDTQYMDYDIGGRAILGDELLNEAIEIVDMDAESITAKSVQNEWPVGTPLVPAKRAVVQQDISLVSITDDTQDMTLTANILVEDIVALPNRITPYTPTTYRGVEVFDPFEFGLNDTSEAAEDDSHMVSEVLDTGSGVFRVDYDQNFAKEGIGYTFFLDGRELISRWLGWFEARAGRLNNLWVPTMVRDVGEIVDMTGDFPVSTIIIENSTYREDYDLDPSRVDLALVQTDETFHYRHITNAERDGENEILTVTPGSLTGTIEANTEYLCFLLMCRLDADEVELAWFTSDLVKATVKFREVPKEAV